MDINMQEEHNNEIVKIKKFNILGEDERGLTAEFSLSRTQRE
jgi:hypothetical protein